MFLTNAILYKYHQGMIDGEYFELFIIRSSFENDHLR